MSGMPAVLTPVKFAQPAPVVLALERQALVLDARIDARHLVVDGRSTVMPGPNRSGVKMTLPSVRRIWLFSIAFVPGWLCLSSRLCV